jgi:hypothetical protein
VGGLRFVCVGGKLRRCRSGALACMEWLGRRGWTGCGWVVDSLVSGEVVAL